MTRSEASEPVADLAGEAGELLVALRGDGDVLVSGVHFDSRRVGPGDLFFCVPGNRSDGHDYAIGAVEAGAVAVVVERLLEVDVPQVLVTDVRRAMGRITAGFLGRPADELKLLGVTGTNGKTTTAYLIHSVLDTAGLDPGLIGTIETRIGDRVKPGVRTTPESVDLHKLFAELRDAGARSVAMEVTSHALRLHRTEGIRFAAVAFTNLSQDHLDFHSDMEDYFAAKSRLFTPELAERGAVNIDDPYGRRLLDTAGIDCVGFGVAEDAVVRAHEVRLEPHGSQFILTASGLGVDLEMKIATSLVGAFNVSNCLAAASVCLLAGIEPAAIESGLAALPAVPGRFEAIDAGQPFSVVVDYAHTPDSLENVLRAAREMVAPRGGRVLCAFGCGGDRDRGKRPLMGMVGARFSDYLVVTSDNPRSEDPRVILDAILEGVTAQRVDGADAVLVDRREAIKALLAAAEPGDIALVAGKGHETGQEFAEETLPFDDREVCREALAALGWRDRG